MRARPHRRALQPVRAVPPHHDGQPRGRGGNRRRVQPRHRRRPPPARGHRLRADGRPLQGLHHRRSAHAHARILQRPAQDAGRAAATRNVHPRHHRGPQISDHDRQPLPAFHFQGHPRSRTGGPSDARAQQGRHPVRGKRRPPPCAPCRRKRARQHVPARPDAGPRRRPPDRSLHPQRARPCRTGAL